MGRHLASAELVSSGQQPGARDEGNWYQAWLQTWLAGDSRGPCALRKVPPAADAGAADAGDAKPVPGMAAERPPEDITLAPDAPAAADGAPEAAPDPEIAAADPGQGSGAVAEAAPDPEIAAPDPQPDAGVTPASLKAEAPPPPPRGNFIPQDSLPQAEGQGSPANSVGALDPREQQREDEAGQNISSAAGAAAAGTPAGDSGAPAVGAPSADAPGGADAESAEEGGALPPLMREHLAEEQQPPLRGPEEPAAGGAEGGPAAAAVAGASDAPAPATQQVAEPGGQNPGAAGSGEPSSGFRGFLARLGWKNMQ